MVLHVQTALVLAVLGLLGLPLLLFESRIKEKPGAWLAFFLGVLLYLVVHDLTDALLLVSLLRVDLGLGGTLSLMAMGLLVGGVATYILIRGGSDTERVALSVAVLVALLLAVHATLDGLVVGSILPTLPGAQVVEVGAIALQALHRAFEGGILVIVFLLAGVRTTRTFAALLYVGLPLVAGAALAGFTSTLVASAVTVLLAFLLAGVFFLLMLLGSWAALTKEVGTLRATPFFLLGFFLALVAHSLAH